MSFCVWLVSPSTRQAVLPSCSLPPPVSHFPRSQDPDVSESRSSSPGGARRSRRSPAGRAHAARRGLTSRRPTGPAGADAGPSRTQRALACAARPPERPRGEAEPRTLTEHKSRGCALTKEARTEDPFMAAGGRPGRLGAWQGPTEEHRLLFCAGRAPGRSRGRGAERRRPLSGLTPVLRASSRCSD